MSDFNDDYDADVLADGADQLRVARREYVPPCDICAGEKVYVDLLAAVLRPCPRCNPQDAVFRSAQNQKEQR